MYAQLDLDASRALQLDCALLAHECVNKVAADHLHIDIHLVYVKLPDVHDHKETITTHPTSKPFPLAQVGTYAAPTRFRPPKIILCKHNSKSQRRTSMREAPGE